MSGCCGDEVTFEGLSAGYRRALWAVIAINGAMFLAEMGAGIFAGSQALKADALDFLGDTVTYALSLFVIGMPLVWRARVALLKGLSLGAMGLGVLAGLSLGGVVLMMVLAASASYIAVPAAMRVALPQANPAIYLTLSLGVTFPFNLTLGIPLYLAAAQLMIGAN